MKNFYNCSKKAFKVLPKVSSNLQKAFNINQKQ
jgi:hypothetical protein